MKGLFHELDADKNGVLDKYELHELLEKCLGPITRERYLNVRRLLDPQNTGTTCDDFCNYVFPEDQHAAQVMCCCVAFCCRRCYTA